MCLGPACLLVVLQGPQPIPGGPFVHCLYAAGCCQWVHALLAAYGGWGNAGCLEVCELELVQMADRRHPFFWLCFDILSSALRMKG